MTSLQATSEDHPTGPDGALRAIGLAAGCIGVAVLAAGTFVLSYQGIRDVALQADIAPRYARGYPLLIDAMLVIVLAAILALRGAGLPSRMLAWLTLLVVLCAAAGADTLHATGRTLPHNTAVVTAAVLPWALVLVAFVLLLAMLRHARLRRQARVAQAQGPWAPPTGNGQARSRHSATAPAAPLPVRSPQPWNSVSIVPGFTSQLVSSAALGAAAGAAVADVEPLADGATPDDPEVLLDGNGHEEAAVDATEAATQTEAPDAVDETEVPDEHSNPPEAGPDLPALAAEPTVQSDETVRSDEAGGLTDNADLPAAEPPELAEDEPGTDEEAQSGDDDSDVPVFRRIRSSPTPPEG